MFCLRGSREERFVRRLVVIINSHLGENMFMEMLLWPGNNSSKHIKLMESETKLANKSFP